MVRSRTDCPARGLVAGGSLLVLAGALYLSARFATVTCAPGLPVPNPAGGCVSAPNLAFEAIGAAAAAAGLLVLSAPRLRARRWSEHPRPRGLCVGRAARAPGAVPAMPRVGVDRGETRLAGKGSPMGEATLCGPVFRPSSWWCRGGSGWRPLCARS